MTRRERGFSKLSFEDVTRDHFSGHVHGIFHGVFDVNVAVDVLEEVANDGVSDQRVRVHHKTNVGSGLVKIESILGRFVTSKSVFHIIGG